VVSELGMVDGMIIGLPGEECKFLRWADSIGEHVYNEWDDLAWTPIQARRTGGKGRMSRMGRMAGQEGFLGFAD
jgi:hypothetical protein